MQRFWLILLVLLLAACGGDGDKDKDKDQGTNESNEGGKLGTVTLSGAVSVPFTVEKARVDDLSAATGTFNIVLADMEDQYSQNMAVLITVPTELAQVGNHPFGQPASVTAPDVPFGTFVDNRESATSYSGTSGSVTLDSVGESWSGSFEFSATTPDGQSVTASGTFSGVPVQVVSTGG